jgi:hypothetical protein
VSPRPHRSGRAPLPGPCCRSCPRSRAPHRPARCRRRRCRPRRRTPPR